MQTRPPTPSTPEAGPTRRRVRFRITAATAICVAALAVSAGCSGESSSSGPTTQPDQGAAGSSLLWSAPTDVSDRVAAAGLDLGPMGMAEHYHPVLNVIIHGRTVTVPPNIGVDPATGAMSGLHTHTADGVIHVEAEESGQTFTLGQFFIEWGVKLSTNQVGDVHAKVGDEVTVTVNGSVYNGDPADLRLEPDQQIEVRVR